MRLMDADALMRQVDTLYYTSFLLRFLEEYGGWMCLKGYEKTIVQECRWYLLEKQLEELGTLFELVDSLPIDKTP